MKNIIGKIFGMISLKNQPVNITQVVFTGTITGGLARIFSTIVGLVTVPLIVSHLGKIEYGLWVLVGQSVSFLTLSQLGISESVSRYVARDKNKNQDDLNQLISTGLVLALASAGLVVLATIAIAYGLPVWLEISAEYAVPVMWTTAISGVSLAMQIPLQVSYGVLRGYQKYSLTNILQISLSTLNMLGVLILMWTDTFGLITLGLVYFSASLFYSMLGPFAMNKVIPGVRVSVINFSWNTAKEILGLGLSASLVSVSSTIYRQGIVLITGKVLSIEEAGIYGVVLGLISLMSSLLTQLTTPLLTLASEIHAAGELERLERMANRMMRISFALGVSTAVGLAFYGESILRFWLQSSDWVDGDFQKAGAALLIMGIGLAIGLPQLASRSILQGVGRHWQVSISFLLTSAAALILSVFLMNFGVGIIGAAVGWALVWVIQGTLIYPPLIARFLEQKLWRMVFKAYFPGGLVGVLVVLSCYSVKMIIPPTNTVSLAFNILAGLTVGCIGILLISGYSLNKVKKIISSQ